MNEDTEEEFPDDDSQEPEQQPAEAEATESPRGTVLAVLYVSLIAAATVLPIASIILAKLVENPSASHTLKSAYDIVGTAGLIVGIICLGIGANATSRLTRSLLKGVVVGLIVYITLWTILALALSPGRATELAQPMAFSAGLCQVMVGMWEG